MALNYNAYYRLARLDKPAGIWLLLLPCWMGLALAGSFDIYQYFLFAIGAVVMRAAGCIINDMADREYDSKVERTKSRPLASGEISMPSAFTFLGILLLLGFLVLVQLPMYAVFVGLCSIPLFIIYPFMKRFTYWPQFFLGLTFNIGILVAYVSVTRTLDIAPIMLYVGAIFWTLGYDTIYAHQDKKDDALIGVKSTALYLGEETKKFVGVFYLAFIITIISAIVTLSGLTVLSIVFLTLAAAQFAWQVYRLDIDNPSLCMLLFKSNTYTGLLIVAGLLAAH